MPGSRRKPRAEGGRPRIRIAHKSAGRPFRRGLRWERLPGSWLVAIVLVMGVLYVPPVHSYVKQRQQTSAQKAELQRLGKENRALLARSRALKRNSTIELEARKLGMVKQGERPYVVMR